jgi:ParB/RepB/Spo0J family partition protein
VKLAEVNPFKVRLPTWDVRYKRDPEWTQKFKEIISRDGVKDPIVVYEPEDFSEKGEYELIDGKTRLLAAREAKLAKIPILIIDKPSEDLLLEAGYRNLWQKDLDPISAAKLAYHILKRLNLDFEKASEAMGISETHFRRLLLLLSLPEEVKEKIALGIMPAFGEEAQNLKRLHFVSSDKKKSAFGVRCPVCGHFPEKGRGKWIYFCSSHEDLHSETLEWIMSGEWKQKRLKG